MEFTTVKIRENLWAIDQQGVRAFLLVGPERSILVDTCFGGDILSACKTITNTPVTLVTTHSDPDHIGGDSQFSDHYIHEAELQRYRKRSDLPVKLLHEGDVLQTGDFKLEIILIPGHTPGSIALLDQKNHFLISGDTVQGGCIFMHGEGRDLTAFLGSIAKLEALRQEGLFDTVYPSHGEAVIPADILEDHLALADSVLSGMAVPVENAPDWFPESVKVYHHGRAQMYFEKL